MNASRTASRAPAPRQQRRPAPAPAPRKPTPRPQRRQQPGYLPLVLEANAILGVNLLLAAIAVSSFVHLVPYLVAQQTKLQTMQAEVNLKSDRVKQLQETYQRSLDPADARRIAQEQGNLIDPQQQKVVWLRSQTQAKTSP